MRRTLTTVGLCGPVFIALAAQAGPAPGVCGDPGSGSCAKPHATPGCDDQACCETVCALNPVCCDLEWDSVCAKVAIDLCGIFIYECEDLPNNPPNDCVADAAPVNVGDSVPFNSTFANTDGPPQPECNSAKGDVQIWKDVWYYWTADKDGLFTASTCKTTEFDTKIAIYDLGGDVPSSIDPKALPLLFMGCNEDCASSAFFASELTVPVDAGSTYLIRVGGYLEAGGPGVIEFSQFFFPPPYTCDNPGPDEFTQSNDPVATVGQVACAGGGITTANQFARSFVNTGEDYSLQCIDFGFSNTGSQLVGTMSVYLDPNGGPPGSPSELTLLANVEVTLPGQDTGGSNCCFSHPSTGCDDQACEDTVCAVDPFCCDTQWDGICAGEAADLCGDLCPPAGPIVNNLIVSFDPPVGIPAGATFVVELSVPASTNGFAVVAGNDAGETAPTYLLATACGINEYVTYADIGFPDSNWALTVIGQFVGSCVFDFNDDGEVNGADLGLLLGAWGPCPGDCPFDLTGDGEVNGADLGLELGAWGPCP